jgi:hypothetical protein
MSQIEELKKLLEDLHKPFCGMIEGPVVKNGVVGPFLGYFRNAKESEIRKLEVKCVCGQDHQ